MYCRRWGVTPLLLLGLLAMSNVGQAQTDFYKPYGATRSDALRSGGAGYGYIAPSYGLGLTRTTYRGYANYYGLPRTPAYRYTTRMPYFSHLQPQYQMSFDPFARYSVPALGSPSSVTYSYRPGPGYALQPQAYTTFRYGPVYHPYTTVSQFVYSPTYAPVVVVPASATYGAYGYSMFYGY